MKTKTGGFTLVEVLVALVVMAVLAGMAWQGVDGMLRARGASQVAVDDSMRLATVVTQWEQDIGAIFDTGGTVPPLRFDGRTLTLTRAAPDGVYVVAWSVRDNAWMRWAGPLVTHTDELQQSWLTSQQLLGNEPGQLRAVEGVSGWQLYFFRGNSWANAQSSGDVIPAPGAASAPRGSRATAREALPDGIRFVLTTVRGTFTRDLLVPPQPQ